MGGAAEAASFAPAPSPPPHATHPHNSPRLLLAATCSDMAVLKTLTVYLLLISGAALGKHKRSKPKGLQCYHCLSFHHPGCWDPEHPDYSNFTVPNIDCYIPGMEFLCIVITAESAQLVETGQEIGPVRARTCVSAKDFAKKTVSYSMCSELSKELSSSGVLSRIAVTRPHCRLCRRHLCIDGSKCSKTMTLLFNSI